MIGAWENHSKGPVFPFGSMIEYHPVSPKDQSRLRQFGKKVLPGELDGSQPSDTLTDDGEARLFFLTIAGNHIYRHVEPRVTLYVPNEESCPIPLDSIDVVRQTNTPLDVLLESRIDDSWNVDGGREVSEP